MYGTIIGQGTFTAPSTIVNQTIAIPQGADWMTVYNYTQSRQYSCLLSGQG